MRTLILAIMILFAFGSFAGESVYTSVKTEDCITLNSSDFDEEFGIDYYDGICRGQGPYTVKIFGGDIRYSLGLLYRGQEIFNLTKTTAFHDLGSNRVEWRYQIGTDGKKDLKALIFRINAFEVDTEVEMLHVVKIDKLKTCTVTVLRNQKNMNQKARKIADKIDEQSCM